MCIRDRIVRIALRSVRRLAHLRQLIQRIIGITRRHIRVLVGLRRPVSSRINRVCCAVNSTCAHLVQHRKQLRQIVVGVICGYAVRARHLGAAAQSVVAEAKRAAGERAWRGRCV